MCVCVCVCVYLLCCAVRWEGLHHLHYSAHHISIVEELEAVAVGCGGEGGRGRGGGGEGEEEWIMIYRSINLC